jgi:replicative DNA helicase Mcm
VGALAPARSGPRSTPDRAETDVGLDRSKAESEIERLRWKGELYEPREGHLRTT